MQDVEKTIISQYANSPILLGLINNINACLDPQANFDAFYNFVWNVMTAQGFGLDIWGRIVGISRYVAIPGIPLWFGFQDGGIPDYTPFNEGPFFVRGDSGMPTDQFALSDMAYLRLILVKALSNISNCSARTINQLLTNLFAGRGRCFVNDLGGMQIQYLFEFFLQPYERAILTGSRALLHPAGVGVSISIVPPGLTFGFEEALPIATFDEGTFHT